MKLHQIRSEWIIWYDNTEALSSTVINYAAVRISANIQLVHRCGVVWCRAFFLCAMPCNNLSCLILLCIVVRCLTVLCELFCSTGWCVLCCVVQESELGRLRYILRYHVTYVIMSRSMRIDMIWYDVGILCTTNTSQDDTVECRDAED